MTSTTPVLSSLQSLEEKGVHLIICSTYLNFYGQTEKVAVGITSGMTDIFEALRRATKVITL